MQTRGTLKIACGATSLPEGEPCPRSNPLAYMPLGNQALGVVNLRFWLVVLLIAPVIALAGCGGGGESEEQKAEVELEEARSAAEAIDKEG